MLDELLSRLRKEVVSVLPPCFECAAAQSMPEPSQRIRQLLRQASQPNRLKVTIGQLQIRPSKQSRDFVCVVSLWSRHFDTTSLIISRSILQDGRISSL